jgi:4-hydroxy-2-oxoglutarate aldolase
LEGIYPPVPTPFDTEGRVATNALTENLLVLNQYKLRGYIVLGSNGELISLNDRERLQVLEAARAAIPSDKLMVAGTGCQSTAMTVELTRDAAEIGADAALILNPSYYKGQMTPEVLLRHFHTVADASPIPVILYNMPACTGIDLSAETVALIAEHENIIGIKDSGGNVVKIGDMRRLTNRGFQVLAGSASFLLPALSMGAVGGVLALANIAPAQCLSIREHFLKGELDQARDLQVQMIPVNYAVTQGGGVPALKAAMDMLDTYGGPPRLPLLPLSKERKHELKTILREAAVLRETPSTENKEG